MVNGAWQFSGVSLLAEMNVRGNRYSCWALLTFLWLIHSHSAGDERTRVKTQLFLTVAPEDGDV